jgi:aryl-alcohol dehydrogenase-like predicted oxidoreductase
MERVQLGRTDIKVSTICFGCWQMGGTYWGKLPEDEMIAAVRRGFDLGVNFFDTADAYGNGHGEEVLGEAIRDLPRDQIVLATKLCHHWLDEPGAPRFEDLSYEYLLWECEQSLRRLGTDYIDVYLAHAWEPMTHPRETMMAFEKLKKDGKIRCAGVSNWTAEQIRTGLRYGRIDVCQPPYNLLQREAEKEVFPLCMAEEIGVMTWGSLRFGLLSGKYAGTEAFDDLRKNDPEFAGEAFKKNVDKVNRLKPIAERLGKTIVQLVLRVMIQHPAVTSPIVGIKRPSQIEDAVGATGWSLSRRDLYAVRDALA